MKGKSKLKRVKICTRDKKKGKKSGRGVNTVPYVRGEEREK
jgi:hypothetical protein